MKKFISLFFSLVISFVAYSQTISLLLYEDEVFSESFNSESDFFTTLVDKENYIVIDKGDLYLNRNNPNTDFITLSNFDNLPKSFRIKSAIKMGPSLKRDTYSGIIINMSDDNSECLGIEINGKKEYRVRKVMAQSSKYLSGTESEKGWVKNKLVKDNTVYNYIDIIYANSSYSIFINNAFAASYEVPELEVGKFGLIIGPNSQSRVDFISVLKKGEDKSADKLKNLENKIDKLSSNSTKLTQLENEYKLEKENNSTLIAEKTKRISELEQEKKELIQNRDRVINDQSKKIYSLEAENKLLVENQKKSLSEKTKVIADLKKKNSTLTQENLKIKDLEAQNSTLRNKLDDYSDLQKENTSLNQKLLQHKKISEENNTLKADLQKKTQTSLSAKNEINNLTKSLNKTKSELAAKVASNEELSISKAALQTELDKVKSQNNTLNQKIKQLDAANKSSNDKNTLSNTKNNELTKKINDLNKTLSSTKNELVEQKKTTLNLQNENSKLTKSLALANSKISESSRMKSDLNDFKNGFIELESSNSQLSEKIKSLNSDLERYKGIEKEFEQQELMLDKTNAALAKKTHELNSLKKQSASIQELNREIATLNDKVKAQNTQLESKTAMIDNLNSKYQSLEKKTQSDIASLTQRLEKSEKEREQAVKENQTVKIQVERQKLIASQFAESYQLEKEKSKQYQNEILNFNLGENNSENKDSVIYRVQLGIFDDIIDIEGLEDLSTIYTKNQQIIYISGKFNSFNSARTYLVKMRERGFEDSFIVKF